MVFVEALRARLDWGYEGRSRAASEGEVRKLEVLAEGLKLIEAIEPNSEGSKAMVDVEPYAVRQNQFS